MLVTSDIIRYNKEYCLLRMTCTFINIKYRNRNIEIVTYMNGDDKMVMFYSLDFTVCILYY